MKRFRSMGLLVALAISACTSPPREEKVAASEIAAKNPTLTHARTLSNENFCKTGIVRRANGSLAEIFTEIKKPTPGDLVSLDDNYFKIVLRNCITTTPQAGTICIETNDRVTVSESNNTFSLRLERKDGLDVAAGTLRFENATDIWAHGTATLPNGDPIGDFYLYSRPKRMPCLHVGHPRDRLCRSILLEYYATNDTEARKYIPTAISTTEKPATVIPLENGTTCEAADAGAETSDGEGDHGPLKP